MDPQQSRCYAKAQRELQELFREISSQGQVGAAELQSALLPFAAGDVRKDVLELIEELRQRQPKSSVDEQEFIRVMWKKMYLSHLTYSSKCRANTTRPASSSSGTRADGGDAASAEFNIPLAHVIVSIKRRSQLKQFADYYASRGISGADHLTAAAPDSSGCVQKSPRRQSPKRQQQHQRRRRVYFDRNIPIPVVTLRAHVSSTCSVVACVFDPEERAMKTMSLFPRAIRGCQIVNCSTLYCLLFSKDAGSYVLGSAHFAQQVHSEYQEELRRKRESAGVVAQPAGATSANLPAPVAIRDDVLVMTKLEDIGLRNVVTAASSAGSFVACTERKIHQWFERKSLRSQVGDTALVSEIGKSADSSDTIPVDLDDEGDCFGLLGGNKLLARTKNIADVSFVKQLSAGVDFTLAVTATGELFAWGESSTLGRNELAPWRTPWFSAADRVARISCGRHHVVAATVSGCAYSWGSNLYGQLGIGRRCSIMDPPVSEPVAIKIPHSHSHSHHHHHHSHTRAATAINTGSVAPSGTAAPDSTRVVLDVACGDDHSLLLLGSGQLYAFGNNWQGQLGIDPGKSDSGCVYEPTESIAIAHGLVVLAKHTE